MASLKRDQSITILPADKGGATVVLDRDAYIQKAEQQLSDETTYKPLQCDPTAKKMTSISKTIDRLVREETISESLANQISPKETSIARAYGLPKGHKDGCPLCMIVSLIDSPVTTSRNGYNVSLDPLLPTQRTQLTTRYNS